MTECEQNKQQWNNNEPVTSSPHHMTSSGRGLEPSGDSTSSLPGGEKRKAPPKPPRLMKENKEDKDEVGKMK